MTANYDGCDCGGEHRTLGGRAWCLDCSEYCYPENVCEIAGLRSENARLRSTHWTEKAQELEAALTDLVTNYATPGSYDALLRSKKTLGWAAGGQGEPDQ